MQHKSRRGLFGVHAFERRRRLPRSGTFASALMHHDLRRCVGYYASAGVARSLTTVPAALVLYRQTESDAWVAAGTVARLLPFLMVSWLAGFVADRFSSRRTLRAMALGQALLLAALAYSMFEDGSPAATLSLIALATVWTTPLFPAVASLVPSIVDDDDLIAAGVIVNGAETLSWVLGPALGGALLVFLDPAAVTVAGAMLSLAGFWTVPAASQLHGASLATDLDDTSVFAGVREVISRPGLAAPLLFVVIANMMNGAEGISLVLVAEELLDTGAAGFGLLATVVGVGGVLGLVISRRLAGQGHRTRRLCAALLMSGIPMGLLAVTADQRIALGLVFVAGAASVATEIAALSIVLEEVPTKLIGRVFGLVDSLLVSSMLLGAVAFPATVAVMGLRASLIVVGTVGPVLVSMLAIWLTTRSIAPPPGAPITPSVAAGLNPKPATVAR